MYKLNFYVPLDALESVKSSVFEAGAGKIGDYDQCCWQARGRGQFRPLSGSNPAIGEQHKLEALEEWKVELVCEDALIRDVIHALKSAHPYEEVAYDVLQVLDPEVL